MLAGKAAEKYPGDTRDDHLRNLFGPEAESLDVLIVAPQTMMASVNEDSWQDDALVEMLTDGPIGSLRGWAATLVLRMLETTGGFRYRTDCRLGGAAHAQAALASLRAAMAVLYPAEQGLLVRAALVLPWEQVRRDTGLSLRLPEILAALVTEVGASFCKAAAQAVVEQGQNAVRQYRLRGLLPEVRQTGKGLAITLDARDRQLLHTSVSEIEIDRLTVAVQGFQRFGWEANLRPLVAWWLATLERSEADRAVGNLLSDLRGAATDDQARWRSLGLLDWLVGHPDHPRAGEALGAAAEVARGDVRKAAADLAPVLGRWDVLEGLARRDPDKGVRQRAEKLLTSRSASGPPRGQGELFG